MQDKGVEVGRKLDWWNKPKNVPATRKVPKLKARFTVGYADAKRSRMRLTRRVEGGKRKLIALMPAGAKPSDAQIDALYLQSVAWNRPLTEAEAGAMLLGSILTS